MKSVLHIWKSWAPFQANGVNGYRYNKIFTPWWNLTRATMQTRATIYKGNIWFGLNFRGYLRIKTLGTFRVCFRWVIGRSTFDQYNLVSTLRNGGNAMNGQNFTWKKCERIPYDFSCQIPQLHSKLDMYSSKRIVSVHQKIKCKFWLKRENYKYFLSTYSPLHLFPLWFFI